MTSLNGSSYTAHIKRVYDADGDPSINHMIILPNTTGTTRTFDDSSEDDDHRIDGLGNTSRVYYLLFAGEDGFYYDDAAMSTIFNTLLSVINPRDGEPSITQISGMPSGSVFPVGTTTNCFVATDLAGNSDTCCFDIVISPDTFPPVFANCPSDTIITNCSGEPVIYGFPQGYDDVSDDCFRVDLVQIAGPVDSSSLTLGSSTTFSFVA
jgi:hypothetical protein